MSQVQPARYEVRVRGHLVDRLRAAFEEFEVAEVPVETVLSGVLADQAALHGLLERIQSLGLELVEVRRLAEPDTNP